MATPLRVLLVNPGMDLEKLGLFAGLLEPMPCIGLAYVASSLERRGHHVRVLDMFASRLDVDEVVARAGAFRPDIVGMTVLTPSAPICERLAQQLRVALPAVRILWGGVHAERFAEDLVLRHLPDAVVNGEGEETSAEVLDAWADGQEDLGHIAGVTYLQDGVAVTTPQRPTVDLDALARPAWHLFPIHRYGLLPFADIARPVLTMTASRGCPFHCDYCSLPHKGRWRGRAPESVLEEYQWLVDRFGVRQIGFVDPIFPLDLRAFDVFVQGMVDRRLPERCVWLSETRADTLTPDLCRAMYRSGCRRLLLGIESASEALLGNVRKRSDPEKVREGVRAARDAGLQTVGLFMIGLPGETPELTRLTVEYAIDLDVDFAKFAMTVPFPGSPIYEELRAQGKVGEDWENYTTFNPDPATLVWRPDGYDPALLVRMQAWAHRRFYLRPRQVRRQLLELRTLTAQDVALGLWGALGTAVSTRLRSGSSARSSG